jgi:CrcB protein
MAFLIVFLGGGIGAALRHGVNLLSARLLGTGFNYATLF